MRHCECKNFISLDCEKGLCALDKGFVPIDGEGSQACPRFVAASFCGNCSHFHQPDEHGIGTCKGMEKESWAYATCGASSCQAYTKSA